PHFGRRKFPWLESGSDEHSADARVAWPAHIPPCAVRIAAVRPEIAKQRVHLVVIIDMLAERVHGDDERRIHAPVALRLGPDRFTDCLSALHHVYGHELHSERPD